MSFQSLLRQTITIEQPTGERDKQGRDEFSTLSSIKARVQLTNKVIVTAERDREPINAIIFTSRSNPIQKSARIVYLDEKYRVMKSEPVPGRNGQIHHYEVMAQLWSFKEATP